MSSLTLQRKPSVSQYSTDTIGIAVYDVGVLADADGDVLVTITRDSDSVVLVDAVAATHDGTGLYSFIVDTTITTFQGTYTVVWAYNLDAGPREFFTYINVVGPQPYWDSLNGTLKQVVEDVYFMVSDTFDSTVGGPYLWELPQTTFSYETIARLMCTGAMDYINYSKPKAFDPPFTIINGAPGPPMPVNWYGLLRKATFYVLLRHLQRSYLEQPTPVGVTVAREDRTNYSDKWGALATMEQLELNEFLRMFKRPYLYGMRSRAMVVAGGLFPVAYLDPARPRWPYVVARF